jgi:serine/threonine protein kinase
MSSSVSSLGKYQVLEEIGRGAMGAVYKGYDPFLDRTVAIKLLAPHLVWESAFVERFLREARSAARLQHSNIIPIYDVGQDGDRYYFVMAYLLGPSLKHLISEKGRLSPTEAIPILRQLADALDYAHSKGLVHRDVKPANVMFNERGQAILTDFGIVKAAQESKITAIGTAMGTPQYMAPEQVQADKDIDARADQYALGIITFEMLTGRVPFDAETVTPILIQQVNEPPPSLLALCPAQSVPPAVETVVHRALSKSPHERYGSCSEFVGALDQALAQPAAEVDLQTPIMPAPTPPGQPATLARPTSRLQRITQSLTPDPLRHRLIFKGVAALLVAAFTYFVTKVLPYYPAGWRWLIIVTLGGLWLLDPMRGLALTLALYVPPMAYNSISLAGLYLVAFLFFGPVELLTPYTFFVFAATTVVVSQAPLGGLLLIAPLAMGVMGPRRGAILGALACLWAEVMGLLAGHASVGLLAIGPTTPLLAIHSMPVGSLQDFGWWNFQADLAFALDMLSRLLASFVELPALLGQVIVWAVAAGVTGAVLHRSEPHRVLDRLWAVGSGTLILGLGHLALLALLVGRSIEIGEAAFAILVPAALVVLALPILEVAPSALVPPKQIRSEEMMTGEEVSET